MSEWTSSTMQGPAPQSGLWPPFQDHSLRESMSWDNKHMFCEISVLINIQAQ